MPKTPGIYSAETLGPYVAKALTYADGVSRGQIPACKWVRLACERQLRDLARTSFEYEFDLDRAHAICAFVEKMPHVKGEWAQRGETIHLEDWQCFTYTTVFGWVEVAVQGRPVHPLPARRFRKAYICVPRKNTKSTMSAPVGLYMLVEDGEPGAEVYVTATNRKQSSDIVFGTAKQMALRAPGFVAKYGTRIFKYNISVDDSASKFEPLHARGGTLDGLNVSCAINDELHAHVNREVHDVIASATGARRQPLNWDITTAGFDNSGICYEVQLYVQKVLEGIVDDETTFGLIYSIDEGDDWTSEATWQKANPNWGVSVYPMQLRSEFKRAREEPAYQRNFLTKYLNVWCGAAAAWMDMIAWDKCADPALSLQDFRGEDAYVGVDLSSKIDMTSVVPVIPRWIDGELHVFVFGMHYLPEAAVEQSKNSQYHGWVRRGALRATAGNVIDVDRIEREIAEEIAEVVTVREIDVDPMHNSTQFSAHMEEAGFECVDVRPTVLNFSEAMKWVEALVKDGRLHHDGCPVMTWAMSNVVAKPDAKDNIYPRKDREHYKIDPAISLLMAVSRILTAEADEQPSVTFLDG